MSRVSDLVKLDALLDAADVAAWAIGDYLIDLIDLKGHKLRTIAERYVVNGECPPGRSYSRLSQYYSNAKEFPENVRRLDIPFDTHEVVRTSAKRVERNAKKQGEKYQVDKRKHLDRIGAVYETGRRLSRTVAHAMGAEATKMINKRKATKSRKQGQQLARTNGKALQPIGNLHHGDYVETLRKMDDGTLQLLNLDPPYGQFLKTSDGKYDMSVTAAQVNACDNETEAEAIATTIAAFQDGLAAKKLATNGVIALWQAGRHLRPQIADAIIASGLLLWLPLYWLKRPQPGDMTGPIAISSEICYLITKPTANLTNLAMGTPYESRQQYWDFSIVHHDAAAVIHRTHAFEKPRKWNELLLHKFTSENDIVFDAFGASGSMVESAIALKRRWVYCERNRKCFDLGSERIQAARLKFGVPNIQAA